MTKQHTHPEKRDHLTLDKKAEEYLKKGFKLEGMPNLKDKEDRKREIRERNEKEKNK